MNLTSRGGVALSLVLAGCTPSTPRETDADACRAPIADAGDDQVVGWGSAVILDGNASQPCADRPARYLWSFAALPEASQLTDRDLQDSDSPDAVRTSFAPDTVGDFVISLVLVDERVVGPEGTVVITVQADGEAPVADCGDDESGVQGERITLDGSGSAAPEGAELDYRWVLSSAPTCSALGPSDVFDAHLAQPTLVADCPGIYVLGLSVSDQLSWSELDYCTVDVASPNRSPVADAGLSRDVVDDNPFELDGFGSYDPDGDGLDYAWGLLDAPEGSATGPHSFDSAAVANPLFTWDLQGEYRFELRVSDGLEWSPPDVVAIRVE